MDENKDKQKNKDFIINEESKNELCHLPEKISKELVNKHDTSTYSLNQEATRKIRKMRKKKKSGFFIETIIMAISFITAFSILSFSLVQTRNASPSIMVDKEETNIQSSSENGKTIYVKEYADKSGFLTPQEIYTSALPSVVSIKASNEGAESIGTGFVFDAKGYIATAHHVVNNMTDVKVITESKKVYPALIVASDELTDLALLKIECNDLVALEFGKSSDLLVGDELFAIGTPASLEFSGSMSRGDVSFINRSVSIYNDDNGTLQKKMTLIQTTAALNPGNSGGPVLDRYGKVVGIVTMKLGNNFDSISFIIPSDGAYQILCDMRDGITLTDKRRQDVATYAAKMGIMGESFMSGKHLGVEIIEFASENCDAARKLKIGDIIVSINGNPIKNVSTLTEEINKYIPGDTVSVTVYRSEQLLTFGIILGR